MSSIAAEENLVSNFIDYPDCQLHSSEIYYETIPMQKTKKAPFKSEDFVWKTFDKTAKININNDEIKAKLDFKKGISSSLVAEMNAKKDLSLCSVLEYDYRGSQHIFFTTSSTYGKTYVTKPILLEESFDWATVRIPLDKMDWSQENTKTSDFLRSVIGFTWRTKGYSSVDNFLEVANVRCE